MRERLQLAIEDLFEFLERRCVVWTIGIDICEFGLTAAIHNQITRRVSYERGHLRRRWLVAAAFGLARICVEGNPHW